MCGIAGVMMRGSGELKPQVLAKLASAMRHRGPDGVGRFHEEGVGLLNTRLAIIDIKGGDQPFEDAQGAVLVANGEIYNDPQIRQRLKDAPYKTGSDCESALHLYRREGINYTDGLRGMYAIAIYDRKASRLILSRDPFGIKQLYYVATLTHFAFASEPQALIAAGLAGAAVNAQKRSELLQLKFTTEGETIFNGIQRVLPGETLVIAGGEIIERHRRPALPRQKQALPGHAQALKSLDEILTESVAMHVRSDVPYGLFLSGGIDSGVLMTLMARISATPVIAFTAAFPESGARDESGRAAKVAKAAGADHRVVEVRREDFWKFAPKVAAALDDPTTDAAALPTFLLARAAREAGLKVVLSGEGADEVFGGYSRYKRAGMLFGLLKRKARTRGALGPVADAHKAFAGWRDGLARTEKQETSGAWSHMQKLQALDCAEWLPNDLLVKLDRCLMAHGVEGRTPFLDSQVSPFGFALPPGLKVKGNYGKWLLRDWLAKNMPAADAWAKKSGFNPPAGEWIASYKKDLQALVLAQPGIAEMNANEAVAGIFRDPAENSQAVWNIVFYALWHSHHILKVGSDGDVGEVLASAARLG